jgi:Bacterial PH domain
VSAGHRHVMLEDPSRSSGLVHEHEFEPVRGLPEELPPGEKLLWQGSPDWRALAVRAFHVRKLVVYFALLLAVRMAVLLGSGAGAADLLAAALFMTLLGAVAVGVMLGLAKLTARAAIYTVTDRRVVMRLGIVLTLAFNIPFKRIESAGLHLNADGTGDIPLALSGKDRIAWLNLWPHVRPWRLARPEPMLRCVPEAAAVARLLSQAWAQQSGVALAAQAPAEAVAPQSTGQPDRSRAGVPALAGH